MLNVLGFLIKAKKLILINVVNQDSNSCYIWIKVCLILCMLKGISTVLRRWDWSNLILLSDNIRCYKGQDRDRVLIKASKDSRKSFKEKSKDIVRNCYPWNMEESIVRLNYLINGIGNFWCIGSNKKIFADMDNYIYQILLRQAKRGYPNKPVKWIVNKHFKESLHPAYNWKWTFTNPATDSQVDRMAWIKIRYAQCIKYKATPYDTEYDEYFDKRYHMTPFEYLYG